MSGLTLLHMNAHQHDTGKKPFVQSNSGSTDPMSYAQDRQITPLTKDEINALRERVATAT